MPTAPYRWTLLAALVWTAACQEPIAGPATSPEPAFAFSGAAKCPRALDFVVSDEAGLLAALAAASPGAVIGINGTIPLTADVTIGTSLTLTCATPGSGLAVASGATVNDLLIDPVPFVTVDRLVLNGAGTSDPFFAIDAANSRFTNNVVTCGTDTCAFLVGTPGMVIADNQFTSNGSLTGVHIQLDGTINPDSVRVERNTIIATAPSSVATFGGIRIVGGTNQVVAGNVVLGPWRNSFSPARVINSVTEGNRFEGALLFGVRMSSNPAGVVMRNNVLRNNRITNAGVAGVLAFFACNNLFVGNNLQGNTGNIGLLFDALSGANTLAGNQNVVVDNGGSFDCNGDFIGDPNIITGLGAVQHGVNFGEIVSDGMVRAHGIVMQ